jgi:ABC-2 type transport system ATP-binding protein/lipopolysaccharide transport system ATP-binding protein
VDFTIGELLLQPGSFHVTTAIVERGHTYDYADRAFDLHIRGQGRDEPGLTRMPGTWKAPVMLPVPDRGTPADQEAIRAER